MEVHHPHHTPKSIKDYASEFLVIFVALTLGFFVENQREHYIEGLREKELAHSLYLETKADSLELAEIIPFRIKKEAYLNELYLTYSGDVDDIAKQKRIQAAQFIGVNANSQIIFEPRSAILTQLESSGMLRYFKDLEIQEDLLKIINDQEKIRIRMQRETDAYHQFVLPNFIDIQNVDLIRDLTQNGKNTQPISQLVEEYVNSSKYLRYPKINPSPAYLKTLRKSIEFYRFLLASTRNNQLKKYREINTKLLQDLRRVYHFE
jgi:hypothetical protein